MKLSPVIQARVARRPVAYPASQVVVLRAGSQADLQVDSQVDPAAASVARQVLVLEDRAAGVGLVVRAADKFTESRNSHRPAPFGAGRCRYENPKKPIR